MVNMCPTLNQCLEALGNLTKNKCMCFLHLAERKERKSKYILQFANLNNDLGMYGSATN